ncbi:kinase [Paenibacillus tarimensis]
MMRKMRSDPHRTGCSYGISSIQYYPFISGRNDGQEDEKKLREGSGNLEDNLKILLNIIPKLEAGQRFVLGLDGLSRSGKTTLAEKLHRVMLEKNVPVHVFHIDDYIERRNTRYHTGQEEWYEYYNLQWDIAWLRDNLFKKLKVSHQLELPVYDEKTENEHNVTIPETCVIVIEGVFLQRQEWRSYFDFVAYLDCPREIRFSRESEATRMKVEKFVNRYWKAEDYYLQTERPTEQADLILHSVVRSGLPH